MKLPYENYIRFLITTSLDSDETKEHLDDLGLRYDDETFTEYWDKQYELLHSLSIPKKVKKFWNNPSGKIPPGFFEYMNVAGLKEAWMYNAGQDKDFIQVIEAVKDANVYIVARGLVSSKAGDDEISAVINGKYAMPFSKRAAALFKKYFFNTQILKRSDWKLHLNSLEGDERQILYLGMMGETEEMRAELGLPVKISVSENYQKLHVFAMERFNKYRKAGDNAADQHAIKWAQLAMSSGDKYEKLKVSDATDFVRDIQMEFDYVDTEFPLIGADDLDEIKSNKDAGQNNDAAEPIPIRDMDEE